MKVLYFTGSNSVLSVTNACQNCAIKINRWSIYIEIRETVNFNTLLDILPNNLVCLRTTPNFDIIL